MFSVKTGSRLDRPGRRAPSADDPSGIPWALIQRGEGSEPRLAPARSGSPATSGTVDVVLYAVVPCLLRPIAMVLTIVVAFLVSLSVGARAPPVMNYLAFVRYAA